MVPAVYIQKHGANSILVPAVYIQEPCASCLYPEAWCQLNIGASCLYPRLWCQLSTFQDVSREMPRFDCSGPLFFQDVSRETPRFDRFGPHNSKKKIWNGRGVGCLWKMHGWGSEIKSSIVFSRPLFYFFGNQSLAVLHNSVFFLFLWRMAHC